MTNYKMLDYLLVRPKDAGLWKDNAPDTLKYIAVDELHTFDGAQGTDLACLLRRLKSRLWTPAGYLCCIGTSATMGSKDNGKGILAGNVHERVTNEIGSLPNTSAKRFEQMVAGYVNIMRQNGAFDDDRDNTGCGTCSAGLCTVCGTYGQGAD